jgi:hypothetical protein
MIAIQSSSCKTLIVTSRHRLILQRILDGKVGRCSEAALNTMQRRGWIEGPARGFQLTGLGRRVAEICEKLPQGQDAQIELPL